MAFLEEVDSEFLAQDEEALPGEETEETEEGDLEELEEDEDEGEADDAGFDPEIENE